MRQPLQGLHDSRKDFLVLFPKMSMLEAIPLQQNLWQSLILLVEAFSPGVMVRLDLCMLIVVLASC